MLFIREKLLCFAAFSTQFSNMLHTKNLLLVFSLELIKELTFHTNGRACSKFHMFFTSTLTVFYVQEICITMLIIYIPKRDYLQRDNKFLGLVVLVTEIEEQDICCRDGNAEVDDGADTTEQTYKLT